MQTSNVNKPTSLLFSFSPLKSHLFFPSASLVSMILAGNHCSFFFANILKKKNCRHQHVNIIVLFSTSIRCFNIYYRNKQKKVYSLFPRGFQIKRENKHGHIYNKQNMVYDNQEVFFSPLSILLWLACGERKVRGSALSGRTGWIQQNEINTRRYRST